MTFWILLTAYITAFTAVVSLVLTRAMIGLAHRYQLMDEPGERKMHTESVPSTGGVAILGAFLCTIALHLAGVWLLREQSAVAGRAAAALAHSLEVGEASAVRRMLGILAGGLVVFGLGYWDDRRSLGPRIKLALQICAALVAVGAGVRLDLFLEWAPATGALTVVWIVLITNAFNLLDNMDGLSGGVAAIAAFMFAFIAVSQEQYLTAVLLGVYIGSLLGFLRYNVNGARIFMGDAGALFIGFVLACLTVVTSFYRPGETTRWVVMVPVLILGVPLFDTASVVLLRWRARVPVMRGDQRHFSHRLVRLGLSPTAAVHLIYLVTAVVGLGATQLTYLPPVGVALVLLQGAGIFAIIALLEWAAARAVQRNGSDAG